MIILAGQDRFKTITSTYYKGAMGLIFFLNKTLHKIKKGIILTYSVSDRNSFNHIESWME